MSIDYKAIAPEKRAGLIESWSNHLAWLKDRRDLIENQIKLTGNSIRSHNKVVILVQGESKSYLNKLDDGNYNFAGDSNTTPRFTARDAAEIQKILQPSYKDAKVVVEFDVDAMEEQLAQIVRMIESFQKDVDELKEAAH